MASVAMLVMVVVPVTSKTLPSVPRVSAPALATSEPFDQRTCLLLVSSVPPS